MRVHIVKRGQNRLVFAVENFVRARALQFADFFKLSVIDENIRSRAVQKNVFN